MSNREKGKSFEKKIKQYLESLSFVVERAKPAARWIGPGRCISGPNDILGCADIMAVHPKKDYTVFIQATSGHGIAPRKKKLETVPWSAAQRVQLWSPQEKLRNGIRVLWLHAGEWSMHVFQMEAGKWPENIL